MSPVGRPLVFLLFILLLCAYHVSLSVVTAGLSRWGAFALALATTLTIALLLLVVIMAYLHCLQKVTRSAVAPERALVMQEEEETVVKMIPRSPRASTALPPQHESTLTVTHTNESDNESLQSPRAPQSTRSLSSSIPNPAIIERRTLSLPVLRQSWLPPSPPFLNLDDNITADGRVTMMRRSANNVGSSDVQVETMAKSAIGTQRPLNRSQMLFSDDGPSGNLTVNRMCSLSRRELIPLQLQEHQQQQRITLTSNSLMDPAITAINLTPSTRAPLPIRGGLPVELQFVVLVLLALVMLLLLAGSFWISYNTGEVMAAIPVFAAPLLYLHVVEFACTVSVRKENSAMGKILRLLVHPAVLPLIALVSLGLYIAVVVILMEKDLTLLYGYDISANFVTAFTVVCMLSPVPVFVTCFSTRSLASFEVENKRLPIPSLPSPPIPPEGAANAERVDHQNPFQFQAVVSGSMANPETEVEESELSSIMLSRYASVLPSRVGSRSGRSVVFASPSSGDVRPPSIQSGPAAPCIRVGYRPQVKSMTLLYVAFRDTRVVGSAADASEVRERNRKIAPKELQEKMASDFHALVDAAKEIEVSYGPFVLTAHQDALCFVWGVQPLSADPVIWAIDAAQDFFTAFIPPSGSDPNYALVAAVLHSPHTLATIVGTNDMSSVHFLSNEHSVGEQLLNRGFLLRNYERRKWSGKKFVTSGLMLDRRAAHLAAAQILTRPVGIVPLVSTPASAEAALSASSSSTPSPKNELEDFTVMYDFVAHLGDKQEEWHLAAHTREKLSENFLPAVEATQAFFQGNLSAAKTALEKSEPGEDDALQQLMLSDVKRIIATSTTSRR
ncbi:hypothetical protein DQ04_00331130 [Trypanosoma grayi]|uniref:hypothetical protein n=1 Tax=Trypanosoma grayi TaxID=71804 RepID=UPI0004F3EF82|nr:hypothetical protein DQ04_00331130 [Trypanosoma grayi]KEG14720.1 hypothetical protein DQ04_00331130 [Trypanosoma grayi]